MSHDRASPVETSCPRPLRVLLALPRPLIALFDGDEGESKWSPAANWDAGRGTYRVMPLQRFWKVETVEGALQVSGAPMAVRVLHHATLDAFRSALSAGYDVVVVDTCSDSDGTLYLEGPCGEARPLSATELGDLLAKGQVHLAILPVSHSDGVCRSLYEAGLFAVVSMADSVREDAARTYLGRLLGQLARGHSLEEASDQACAILRHQWGARLDEDDLPRLIVPEQGIAHQRLVELGSQGTYARLHEPPGGAAPHGPAIRLRGRELDQVLVQRSLLSADGSGAVAPLVTLHGFDGVGKTALAHAVALWCWERGVFPGGVHLVRLAGVCVSHGDALADRLLRALDLPPPEFEAGLSREDVYRIKLAALCDVFEDGAERLLVLDDFEALGKGRERAVALVSDLRERFPQLHFLLTSRLGPLGLIEERPYELGSLEMDAAIEVFRDRALDAGKMLLHAEHTIVAEICELLDRVPLYIRLVAGHMRTQESPTAILEGLRSVQQRYGLTAAERPGEPSYLLSRELALRYTYDQLDEHGQRLWAVMAGIFAGAPGRADVRTVYAHFRADLSLDALLLWSVVESVDGQHQITEVARAFGRQRLAEGVLGEEADNLRARHAARYLDYAREHAGDYDALERYLPDILAGLGYAAADATRDDEAVRGYTEVVQGLLKTRGY